MHRSAMCHTAKAFVLCVPLIAVDAQAPIAIHPFGERFEIVDSVVLKSTQANPIARISGVAALSDGRFVVTDISEGTVRLYARDGSLQSVLGGKGAGPGEFRAPVLPRVDLTGRIHVADIGLLRVTVFAPPSANGTPAVLRTVSIAGVIGALFGFEILPSGDYLFSGVGPEKKRVLYRADSTGKRKASYLDVREYVRGPAVEPGVWEAITVTTLGTDGKNAYAALSTFDSLWTVDLVSGKTNAEKVPFARYQMPEAPKERFTSRNERRSWATSQTVVAVFATRNHVFMPVFQGTYNEGKISDVAYRAAGSAWAIYSGMPAILSVQGDTVIALRSAEDDARVLRIRIKR